MRDASRPHPATGTLCGAREHLALEGAGLLARDAHHPPPHPIAGIPFAQQRLLLGGKQLPDAPALSASGVGDGSTLHLVLSLRGGGPKKDKGKGKGKGKDKGKGKGEGKAPLAEGEEMSEEQLKETIAHLRSELDHEREERNYFQLERDKINTFWEISKKELEDRKAELRNKDREMEELEERHQVRIRSNRSERPAPLARPPAACAGCCCCRRLLWWLRTLLAVSANVWLWLAATTLDRGAWRSCGCGRSSGGAACMRARWALPSVRACG